METAHQVIDRPTLAAFPNPFSERVQLNIVPPKAGTATINIFDVRGSMVYTQRLSNVEAGNYSIEWDGRASGGTLLSAGVYIVSLDDGEQQIIHRLVIGR